ncbi:MAG: Hpt domain-containing protein [Roseiarcus sp.]|jgi:HPt (histidine-containing phosphotransfer) domain-containing protein
MTALASNHSDPRDYQTVDSAPRGRAADFAGEGGAATEPAVDLVHLARQTDGDEALERELLDMFDRQSARILDQLRDARADDARIGGDLAHTLKGSALAIGAGRVARSAQDYESAFAAGLRGGALVATLDALAAAVAEARAAIASLLC